MIKKTLARHARHARHADIGSTLGHEGRVDDEPSAPRALEGSSLQGDR